MKCDFRADGPNEARHAALEARVQKAAVAVAAAAVVAGRELPLSFQRFGRSRPSSASATAPEKPDAPATAAAAAPHFNRMRLVSVLSIPSPSILGMPLLAQWPRSFLRARKRRRSSPIIRRTAPGVSHNRHRRQSAEFHTYREIR